MNYWMSAKVRFSIGVVIDVAIDNTVRNVYILYTV